MRTSLGLLCAASLAAISCSDSGMGPPRPSSVEPSSGLASQSTRVVIRGDGFLARPSEQQSGGGETIDARHRAWLGDAELGEVIWIDAHTLEATVPAGLPSGAKRLLVENAFGQRGALENAFTVNPSSQTPPALSTTLAVQGNPSTVLVGQALSMTLTVSNTGQGGASVTAVNPTVSPAGAATCGPFSPTTPQAIPGLGSKTFTWICTGTTAGSLTLGASVAGIATADGATLQATAPGVSLTVQLPAELTATIAASRSTANVGQVVTATLTLTNGGSSTANVTSITRNTGGAGTTNVDCSAVTPALPISVPAGATLPFTWSCTPRTAGTLVMNGTASGTDAASGGAISATPAIPATVLVQLPAALSATLAPLSTTVTIGQPVNVTLTVRNTGGASAQVSAVAPTPAICGTVTGAPQTIAGGAIGTFTWSCMPSAAGTLALDATVTASDANTGAVLSPPVAPVNVTVLPPATLVATILAVPLTVKVGDPVDVTLTLTNSGTATANVTAVALVLGAGSANCVPNTTPPTQETPTQIPGNQSRDFLWTCTPDAVGTLSLSATASGTVEGSGSPISAPQPAPATVTVQFLATLEAASPTTVPADTQVALKLTVANLGTVPVTISTVTPNPGAGPISCTAPIPSQPLPLTLPRASTTTFTWSCTPRGARVYSVSATVSATNPPLSVTSNPVTITAN